MQLWEYIPVLLGTGGFVAMLDDSPDGYIYRCKPVRIFVTACIAAAATALCWFIRIFVPVLMAVCGIIYVAEVLYSLRAHFVYVYSRRKRRTTSPSLSPLKAAPQRQANMRLPGESALYPMPSLESKPQQRPKPLPL